MIDNNYSLQAQRYCPNDTYDTWDTTYRYIPMHNKTTTNFKAYLNSSYAYTKSLLWIVIGYGA